MNLLKVLCDWFHYFQLKEVDCCTEDLLKMSRWKEQCTYFSHIIGNALCIKISELYVLYSIPSNTYYVVSYIYSSPLKVPCSEFHYIFVLLNKFRLKEQRWIKKMIKWMEALTSNLSFSAVKNLLFSLRARGLNF